LLGLGGGSFPPKRCLDKTLDKTGLRPKKSVLVLVLVLQIWCCVVKHDLATLVVIMILKDTATFKYYL